MAKGDELRPDTRMLYRTSHSCCLDGRGRSHKVNVTHKNAAKYAVRPSCLGEAGLKSKMVWENEVKSIIGLTSQGIAHGGVNGFGLP